MLIRRVTARHTVQGATGETFVELVGDMDANDDAAASIQMITAAAIASANEGAGLSPSGPDPTPPPQDPEWDPEWADEAPPAPPNAVPFQKTAPKRTPQARGPKPPDARVRKTVRGWAIECPAHGEHAARLFDARDGMPARIKCTAKDGNEFCKVGATPPGPAR